MDNQIQPDTAGLQGGKAYGSMVCGGAGYIGSHTCLELIGAGYDVIVADNLVNSCEEAVVRTRELAGKDFPFVKIDLCDLAATDALFAAHPEIDSVIHFAGLKAVGESVAKPLEYYDNNLTSTLVLLKVMRKYGVKNFVFSSSATVYGIPTRCRSPRISRCPPPIPTAAPS